MSNLHFAASSAPLKSIQEIQFGLMAPDEIQNMSVAHIIYPETMVRMCVLCDLGMTDTGA
ncbi:hypothetical protein HDK77DRAFT_447758 [Phyllosticta capitalensis]